MIDFVRKLEIDAASLQYLGNLPTSENFRRPTKQMFMKEAEHPLFLILFRREPVEIFWTSIRRSHVVDKKKHSLASQLHCTIMGIYEDN